MDKPDVVLVMNVANGFWLPFFKVRRIPTLLNVDGIEWDRQKWGRAAKFVFRVGARASALWADELVCDSHEIVRRWRNDFRVEGTFIPYGGDVPGGLPVEPGLTSRGYVLVVARFVPENTIEEFLRAVELMPSDTDVVIVGSSGYGGEFDERARALSERRQNVRWLGHVNDDRRLFALWQHAGVYFHGHSVGGTNPALVQAMACKAPVVARDTVYNREVLGDFGRFVDPTPEAIRDAVLALLSDSAQQEVLREGAFVRSREIYSWEAVCEGYEQALLRLIDTSRRK
ncbi:glycosyltransferase involved in cell wall biosynthesis [Herbiconiux flava]|uniref:Glycosyltransferase involved in cell wall biosynthesis n=1 Tax=Herbiconiux flava TaxID=881268 RepID=A0A852SLF6_9MICO|nr:glycosyltransferase involved in cell wall biosynthesis [Herbiconiux flava]